MCPTPIGNLEDITLRVLKVLQAVDIIAAEDTRRTRKLLTHFQISTPLLSYREHNRKKQGESLLERLEGGKEVALVSDAGMPGIADPGFELIRDALERGIQVEVLPGPSAILTALLESGLPPVPFVFYGFLPPTGKKRREALEEVVREDKTVVLYEAPHRLVKTLKEIFNYGDRPAAVCREMTKKFAETRRGSLSEHIEHFEEHEPRGEFALVLSPGEVEEDVPLTSIEDAVLALMGDGYTKKEAIKEVARERGLKKSHVYRQCHKIRPHGTAEGG